MQCKHEENLWQYMVMQLCKKTEMALIYMIA
jgi:hypothetical protein